jgi:hypothetical protein
MCCAFVGLDNKLSFILVELGKNINLLKGLGGC